MIPVEYDPKKKFKLEVYPLPMTRRRTHIKATTEWVAKIIVPEDEAEDCWASYIIARSRGAANRKARRWCRKYARRHNRRGHYSYTYTASGWWEH